MNTKRKYQHNFLIEERYFSKDIESLMQYDSDFREAYETGNGYEFTIQLKDIASICPRHKQEREAYRRFIRFLKSKNITMNLVSRKKGHKDLSENKLKLKDNGKSIN